MSRSMASLLTCSSSKYGHRLLSVAVLVVLVVLGCGSITTRAAAQETPSSSADVEQQAEVAGASWVPEARPPGFSWVQGEYELTARLGVWFPALSGDVSFGGAGNTKLDLDSSLGLDDNEAAFSGDLRLTFGRWEIWGDVFEFDTDSTAPLRSAVTINGTNIAGGTLLANEFSLTGVGIGAGYDLFGDLTPESDRAVLTVQALGGIRGLNIDQSVRGPGGNIASYNEWHPLLQIGGRVSLVMDPQLDTALPGTWEADVAALLGYGGLDDADVSTLDLIVTATYMPHANLGLYMGFRLFRADLTDDDPGNRFEFDGSLAGMFVGGIVRF